MITQGITGEQLTLFSLQDGVPRWRLEDQWAKKLLEEMQSACSFKYGNYLRGTATQYEKDFLAECQGFLSLLNYSVLTPKQIYDLWDNSQLRYR